MGNTGVIDHFLEVFTQYIDSGFGLVHGDVAFVATTLIVIDVTLAALFWTFDGGGDSEIIARLVKKTLFVGAFAYLIGNWNSLAAIVFNSFAGLGLKASGSGFTVTDLMRPGKLAQTGLDAGAPLLQAASDQMGVDVMHNLLQIACLGLAWVLVVLAFFILAIQMFVVLIEFKLTTLAGFVLIPFGLFGKSAFMAEKVLGNVVSSGIKVLVLAVITGIGSTLFASFVQDFGGSAPTIEDAMSVVLASLTLLGLGIFGPAVANGLVSGGPQLGAGSAVGAGLAAGGALAAGALGMGMAARGASALATGAVGAARTGAAMAGGASTAYSLGRMGKSGASAVAGGLANVAKAATAPMSQAAQATADAFRDSFKSGGRAAFAATGGQSAKGTVSSGAPAGSSTAAPPSASAAPQWASDLRQNQSVHNAIGTAVHAIRSGDASGSGHSLDLKEGS
ncbi:P-type conjugative transfer protein TrbL [Asticcacaulis sp.]|uniref:P-type conjugative transfer protein TrbL n=1 Tax=Asticcacaulis sp. TaxID=1872648 RepID=UPI002BC42538|nr:P-type conjugative transfer protein TrbL [Asticcacaulis sp.]HTM82248.1 P-type conjugative transfer protein TrbL [Asticcacaulis sp.]